jgi:superkiller protein 3
VRLFAFVGCGSSSSSVRASLDTALGVSLVPYYTPKHHPRALRLLNGVVSTEPSNTEARFARALISQSAEKWAEAREEFQHLLDVGGGDKDMVSAKEEVGWCLVNEGKLEEGRDILEEVVEKRDSRNEAGASDDEAFARARAWWRLGQTEWMIGGELAAFFVKLTCQDDDSKAHAEEWFMASIRALPTYAPAFTSLGLAYTSANPPDPARALKCYQKAFELDATEAESARRLAIGYADEDEWASVRTIAVRVMEGEGGVEGVAGGEALNVKGRFAPRNGWAWKALGSTEMVRTAVGRTDDKHYKNYAKAASAYQIALRAEPDDVTTWTQLGEAYLRSGRHMAALKTLEHALELDPKYWMAYYHIGDIHSQLGSFDLAIEAYEKVSNMTGGKEIGVLAAIAGGMLSAGRQNAAGGFTERSRRAFRGGMQFAGNVLRSGEGHRPWGWKIIGDAAFELYAQESSHADVEESAECTTPLLQLLADDDVDRRSRVDGVGHASNLLQSLPNEHTTLKTSVLAYAYRAHLLKNEPRVINYALYDLACSLHALAGSLGDATDKNKCVKGAMAAIRLALDRDAGDERYWDAFGVICAGLGDEVAQHAFVVSLELYAKVS